MPGDNGVVQISVPSYVERDLAAAVMQLREATLLKLDGICRTEGVKLLAVRSYGLVATLRVSTQQGPKLLHVVCPCHHAAGLLKKCHLCFLLSTGKLANSTWFDWAAIYLGCR